MAFLGSKSRRLNNLSRTYSSIEAETVFRESPITTHVSSIQKKMAFVE